MRRVPDRATLVSLAMLAAALLLAGCRGAEPAASPTPVASTSPSSLPSESTTATAPPASATPAPTVNPTTDPGGSPTAPPSPTDGPAPTIDPAVDIGWQLTDADVFTSFDVISDAAALGTTVVAVGSTESDEGVGAAGAWYSIDGITWQAADDLPQAEDASIDGVSPGPGGMVAVGFDYSGEQLLPAVWRTADGRSWVRVSDADLTRGEMAAVAGGPGGYVALGTDFDDGTSLIWTSADGADWSAATPVAGVDVGAAINGLAASEQGWVAFGSSADGSARVWHSADGSAWQLADGFGDEADSAVNDIAVSAGRFVAVGARYLGDTARALVWTSANGSSWQAQPIDLDGEMIGVEAVGDGFYAVGAVPEPNELVFDAGVWASADGAAWQRRADDASFELARMIEVFQAGPGLVAIGEKAIDEAGEELSPAVWLGVPR